MQERNLEKVGREPFKRNLFLPKYQQIIQELYMKARERDDQDMNERNIPTIEDLNRLNYDENLNTMKEDKNK